MHELALAEGLVDLVTERTVGRDVVAVNLRVGDRVGRGRRRDRLLLRRGDGGTPLEGAVLRIEEVRGRGPLAGLGRAGEGVVMCLTCGCGDADQPARLGTVTVGQGVETLEIEERLLAKNDHVAAHVRESLDDTRDHGAEPDELARSRQDLVAGGHDRRAPAPA